MLRRYNESMEPYVIKRGNRWVKHMVFPIIAVAFALIHYDVLDDASIALGIIPFAFAFEPRSWTFKGDGSIAYKDKKTLIVFRPAPVRKLQRKKGNLHLVFQTGRILDFPVAGLKKREKDSIYTHIEKSLVR